MPVQDYNINTRDAVAGQIYGISTTNAVRHSWKLEDAPLGFGQAMIKTGDRSGHSVPEAHADTAITADFFVGGLSIRQVNREQATRPGDGNVNYAVDDIVGVLLEGFMQVQVGNTGFTFGSPVYVDVTTGEFFGAAGANRFKATNMRFESSGAGNEIAIVQIANNAIHA